MSEILGIDLGTCYSCIAQVDEHGQAVVVPNSENERTTPSVVMFAEGGDVVVGNTAKEHSKVEAARVVSFIKRQMGKADYRFAVDGNVYRPEEISSYVLRKLVKDAEQNLNRKITDVVITCPAYFGINEIDATRKAGEIAGLKVREVLKEPTAAAIAYGLAEVRQDKEGKDKVVLVYDLGGGTFDVTMISIKPSEITVICTGGDPNLGGKDWDECIIRYMIKEFCDQTGLEPDKVEQDNVAMNDLQLKAEKLKRQFAQLKKVRESVIHDGQQKTIELTLEKFNELTQHLLDNSIALTKKMLEDARAKGFDKFDELLLVGGSSKMQQVQDRVKAEFGLAPKLYDPDEAVAKGAALYAWKLEINDQLIERIAEKTGKTTDTVRKETTEKQDPSVVKTATNEVAQEQQIPVDWVIDAGRRKIRNVCSKSFGIVAEDPKDGVDKVVNLILRNTEVPANVTERFATKTANQVGVDIKIMENEVSDKVQSVEHSQTIGEGELPLPPRMPAQHPIFVRFELNTEGLLEIRAVALQHLQEIDAQVTDSIKLQDEQLTRAINEAVIRGKAMTATIKTTRVIQEEELKEAIARSSKALVS